MPGMPNATPPADVSAKPRRRFRRLRIAVSVFFGVLTLVLCVLWVRSYWRYESAHWPCRGPQISSVTSYRGSWCISKALPSPDWADSVPTKVEVWSKRIEHVPPRLSDPPQFDSRSDQYGWWLRFPHWFPVAAVVVFAAVPWIPMSRRTMFIATTLFAIVLGLVCYTVQ